MIQRIQTVFLLLACGLMALTAFSPLLIVEKDATILDFFSQGIFQSGEMIYPTWGVMFMAALGALSALIAVFLFKNRKLQLRVVRVVILAILLFYLSLAVYYYVSQTAITDIQYGIILPVVALILSILALSKINKDEKLVKSLDRIR